MPKVDYITAARRHFNDASFLEFNKKEASAGQLFGFSVECGLKAALVASGVKTDKDGNVTSPWREHLPRIHVILTMHMALLPNGRASNSILSHFTSLPNMSDWNTDHRYCSDKEIPLTSLAGWGNAALESAYMLDKLISGGKI